MIRRHLFVIVTCALGIAFPTFTQAQAPKKMLDHSSYDLWNSVSFFKLSPDGKWVHYVIRPTSNSKSESTMHLVNTKSKKRVTVARGAAARFTDDSQYLIYIVPPERKKSSTKTKSKAPPKGKPPAKKETPQSKLIIRHLSTGKTTTIEKAGSYILPTENQQWLAYTLGANNSSRIALLKKLAEKYKKAGKALPSKLKEALEKTKPSKSTKLHIRHIATGKETIVPDVTSYRFAKNGRLFAYVQKSKDVKKNGVYVVDLRKAEIGKPKQIVSGAGKYQSLTFDDPSRQLAFLTTRDDAKSKSPAWSVYRWKQGSKSAAPAVTNKTPGIPTDWRIASGRSPSFSRNGKRLFFGTEPVPAPTKSKSKLKVAVEIWHWRDPLLQPMQKVQARINKSRTYLAVLNHNAKAALQLATEDMQSVKLGVGGNSHFALGSVSKPYHPLISWDYPRFADYVVLDLRTGKERHRLTKIQGSVSISPSGKYLTWWDTRRLAWMAMRIGGGKTFSLSAKIPHPVHDELHDQPSPAKPYGGAGWIKGDKAVLIYDKHDIWAVDPESPLQPICITDGVGRKKHLRFRSLSLNLKDKMLEPAKPLLLTAFDLRTKSSGFYRERIDTEMQPHKLFAANESLASLQRSENGSTFAFTRSTFRRFPDYWLADRDFKKVERLTNANPQQSKFRWGTASLVEWTSLDGNRLQGVLYKPDGFNPKKKYPLLVYFYERNSQNLYRYITPSPARASINISFYVSRGYVIFMPDIPYRVGHPGQSCLNAVLPGVASLVNQGFIDKHKIGVQGHSWGGYQIAYLVTRTKMFAAAEAGAPVSNMTSAYGGIRWSSGMSRMFQYEKTQSRIGGTLWDAQHRYIENSPVFWADRVETPLLMMHNDRDGAVPWYQGIELFVALRRLGKPCWMVNYNGEQHGLTKDTTRRDWSIRMQQFFDHYLKGAAAPRWLADGVPYEQRKKTTGLELKK